MRVCRTWTFTRGHKRDATSERGAAFSSQSPKAGHWTPRAKVYIQIPGHLTSTMLNFLQYIRLCHIQISGQMQTPKVFLLLSCILHQYRTSAKAFSSRPTSRKVQRNSSVERCKSNKTLLFCQILKGSYIWQILFQCVLDKGLYSALSL